MKEQSFLPAGYEPPKATSRYTKFEEGKTTRFRILSSPILGWEYWDKTDKPKPIRIEYTEEGYKQAVVAARKNQKLEDQTVRHFWAMQVWNYDTKQIEICEITQKTILAAIRNYIADDEYGSPLKYDIKVTKNKDKDKVTYDVSPGVPKETPPEAIEEFEKGLVNLNALFKGQDPFDTTLNTSELNAEDVF